MYSIIDIETTGGAGRQDRITEIAIFVHDGEKIVDEFISLINPECFIPQNITDITGIDNRMVANAPKFYEVAKKVVELTEGTIFVAHSVNFDYSFIRGEFKRLGYHYNRKRLCTVKLARKFLPGHKSYSLGKVCADLGISINGRHRAGGDAAATVKLFELILEKNGNNVLTDQKQWVAHLPENLSRKTVEALPEEKGVYYFFNSFGSLIYVGKSNNIYSRILSHLGNVTSKKAMEMKENICDISYICTGSELIALLLESHEIKSKKPFYNIAQKKSNYQWGIQPLYDIHGYLTFEIIRLKSTEDSLLCFTGKLEARGFVERLVNQFELCPKLSGIYQSETHCFNYLVAKCNGACVHDEDAETYNERAMAALEKNSYVAENFVLFDEGRHEDEQSYIIVENGRYIGYGFVDKFSDSSSVEDLKDIITVAEDNRDVKRIINGYMSKKKGLRVVRY